MLPLDTYGMAKRVEYIKDAIERLKPKSVLEFGCGTGNNVIAPLAKLFPDVRFVGVDSDSASIEFARKAHPSPNLTFAVSSEFEHQPQFDMIIATEVIEHVDEPDGFLKYLKEHLTDQGRLILTLPNGYGPFEMVSLLESLLHLSGVLPVIRKIKLAVSIARPTLMWSADTLAVSPHVNFFSFREIRRLVRAVGLKILHYRPRTFLCGFGFDSVLRGKTVLACNARMADYLPRVCNSGWMFTLEKREEGFSSKYQYHRNLYARCRKYLNLKRWGVKQ